MMPAISSDRPRLMSVMWAFLRIGAVAFGGLGATLALLERDLVNARGWLRSSDVAAALAYTKPLPGSTVVQVVTFLGWRLRGNHRDRNGSGEGKCLSCSAAFWSSARWRLAAGRRRCRLSSDWRLPTRGG